MLRLFFEVLELNCKIDRITLRSKSHCVGYIGWHDIRPLKQRPQ